MRGNIKLVQFFSFMTILLILGSIGSWEMGGITGVQLAARIIAFPLLDLLFTVVCCRYRMKRRKAYRRKKAAVYYYQQPASRRSVYALQAK